MPTATKLSMKENMAFKYVGGGRESCHEISVNEEFPGIPSAYFIEHVNYF